MKGDEIVELPAMRYKDYIFRCNPSRLSITSERRVKELPRPFLASAVQDMGPAARRITGEGEFFGQEAFDDFAGLAALVKEEGPGELVLPGMEPMSALFEELQMLSEPGPGCIGYRFVFVEVPKEQPAVLQNSPSSGTYSSQAGESLWNIAQRTRRSVQWLMEHNPNIKNPCSLKEGTVVKI